MRSRKPSLTVPLASMLLKDVRRSNLFCKVTIFSPCDHSYSTLKSLLETLKHISEISIAGEASNRGEIEEGGES